MQDNKGFFERVYVVVRQIPLGCVATYGLVAAMIGAPKCARQVGFALHANPYFGDVPCHRVVNRLGYLAPAFAFGGCEIQREMLEKEGVIVNDNKVDLSIYRWNGNYS